MALKDHYSIEDYPMMIDQIENLMNVFQEVLHMAENAEFSSKEEQLARVNQSLEILMALNKKKQERENCQRWIDYYA